MEFDDPEATGPANADKTPNGWGPNWKRMQAEAKAYQGL